MSEEQGQGEMTKRCDNCNNAVLVDFGYTNWTVEGTEVYCMLKLNPQLPKDRWYGADPAMEFAENCPQYKPLGPRFHIDAEGYELHGMSDEDKALLNETIDAGFAE